MTLQIKPGSRPNGASADLQWTISIAAACFLQSSCSSLQVSSLRSSAGPVLRCFTVLPPIRAKSKRTMVGQSPSMVCLADLRRGEHCQGYRGNSRDSAEIPSSILAVHSRRMQRRHINRMRASSALSGLERNAWICTQLQSAVVCPPLPCLCALTFGPAILLLPVLLTGRGVISDWRMLPRTCSFLSSTRRIPPQSRF